KLRATDCTAKCVVVGDFEADKCGLLQAAAGDRSHCHNGNDFCPGVFENRTVDVDIGLSEDGPVSLSLWDTTGLENYDRLMALIYPETDVFIICFSLTSPQGWRRVLEKWHSELRQNCPDAAIVLVGTNLEQRNSAMTSSLASSSMM
uniref:Rho-related GTP-binding protein RhoU n=1 Tax=Macrostomum lignano TaxID=282301 RepID=A0A1I8JF52_9PLAT